jgi:hypothetical protein
VHKVDKELKVIEVFKDLLLEVHRVLMAYKVHKVQLALAAHKVR